MKVNNSIKRYWARTGPSSVFGSDWRNRNDFSDNEAEERFDQVWGNNLYPAIQSGKKVSAASAKARIPDDKRRDYFNARQEHREVQLCGTTLLAQIDIKDNRLTQLWHLKEKNEDRTHSSLPPASSSHSPAHGHALVPSASSARNRGALAQLAGRTGLPKAELAAALAAAIAEILLGID
jgi:hypothetical protein